MLSYGFDFILSILTFCFWYCAACEFHHILCYHLTNLSSHDIQLELFQKFHFPGFFPCFLYLINNYFLLFFNAISGKPSYTSNTISCKCVFLFYGQYEYLELSPNVEMNLVLFVYLMYRIGTIVLFFYVVQLFNQINIWNVVWSFMLCNWTQWQTRDFIRLF